MKCLQQAGPLVVVGDGTRMIRKEVVMMIGRRPLSRGK